MMNLAFEVYFFILRSEFLHAVKSHDLGLAALLLPRMKGSCEILSALNTIVSAAYEHDNLGSNNKHANLYTTEATDTLLKS
jgi:hypothetical protein